MADTPKKPHLLARVLVLYAAIFALGNGTTDELTLQGSISPRQSMTIVELPQRSLSSSSTEEALLAKIIEINNVAGGFVVSLSSSNGQQQKISISYNNRVVDLSQGPVVVATEFREAGSRTVHTISGHLVEPEARAPASANPPAQSRYLGTLTFSVAAI